MTSPSLCPASFDGAACSANIPCVQIRRVSFGPSRRHLSSLFPIWKRNTETETFNKIVIVADTAEGDVGKPLYMRRDVKW